MKTDQQNDRRWRYPLLLMLAMAFLGRPAGMASAGMVDPALRKALQAHTSSDRIPVIVHLTEKADVHSIRDAVKGMRRAAIVRTLRNKAETSQKDVDAFLRQRKAEHIRSLWIANAVAASVGADDVDHLAARPGVERVELDAVVHAPVATYATGTTSEWNLNAVHVPELWALGHTGQGVVVANMDTGVDFDHPDLQLRWRGGSNSWYDPHNEHALTPYDAAGHGTQTMGIMVGGDAGGTAVGVAPGAQWIAVKIFNDAGDTTYSVIHQGFQWLLDPDGDADTDDAPDVVNHSWGLVDPSHGCITEFLPDVQALRAAGIAMAFSAGNDGPGPSTSVSPANYTGNLSVGAVDSANALSSTSSRGPSACYGDYYPAVVAPGVDVRTTDLFLGIPDAYVQVSGTSFAAPHVAGALALLLNAYPSMPVPPLERSLLYSAIDLGVPGTDNDHGYGMVDVLGAYRYLSTDRISVYENGIWYLDLNGNGSWDGVAMDRTATFGVGLTGAVPVAGDWSGTGATGIGVFDHGTWYLDLNGNGSWDGAPFDAVYSFGVGLAGAVPVTGDWTGTGSTKIGVYADGTWYLDLNGNGVWDGAPTDAMYVFGAGLTGAIPVTGDWNGSGSSKVGVFIDGSWYLDWDGSGAWDGAPADALYAFGGGVPNVFPVTGDWNGDGSTKIGVFSEGAWYIDLNGDGAWSGYPADRYFAFGFPSAVPVSGRW